MLLRLIESLQKHPKRLRKGFFICLGVIALADLIAPRHEQHFFGDTVPLFWTFFGLAGCVIMAVICKLISKKLLARDEGFYEN